MNKGRRIAALAATTMAVVGMTSVMAAPASAAATGPRPVAQLLDTVVDGRSEFVRVKFTTDRTVCHVKLRVRGGARVDVEYPHGRSSTSLSRDTKLTAGEVDFAAFRVTADVREAGSQILGATVTFDHCGRTDPTLARNTGFLLPVTLS